jgi:hypothetical protein
MKLVATNSGVTKKVFKISSEEKHFVSLLIQLKSEYRLMVIIKRLVVYQKPVCGWRLSLVVAYFKDITYIAILVFAT